MAKRSAGAITISIEALTKGLDKGLDGAKKSVQGFGGQMEKMGKGMKDVGGKMVATGAIAATMGAGILGFGTVGINTFANFDDKMRQTQAIMGETPENFARMTNSAKNFGATTAHSASAVAEGYSFMALAGWKAKQSMDAMEGTLALASASGLDLATTTDILTDTMSQFTLDASKANNVSDIFALTQARTNTSVYQLGYAMKYAGGKANGLGMDLSETNAVLGIFGDNGLKGSMAGTTFTAMMDDMNKTNRDGANVMEKELGVAMFDAQGQMRSMSDIAGDLRKATKGMTAEQRNQALGAIFGSQSIKGVNALLSDQDDKLGSLTEELRNTTGTAKEMADEMESGAGGGIRQMQSALESMWIEIGESLAPVIMDLIPVVIKLVSVFANFVQANPGVIQAVVIAGGVLFALGTVITTVGGFLMGLGQIITTIGFFIANWATITTVASAIIGGVIAFLTSPITLVIGAIALLGAAIFLLWKNWDTVSKWITKIWQDQVNKVKTNIGIIVGVFQKIPNIFKNAFDKAIRFASPLIDALKTISNLAGGIGKTVGGAVSKVKGFIPKGFIRGYADGGFVGNAGASISRSNGDNRLITARDDEFIANQKQRDNLFEAIANGGLKSQGSQSQSIQIQALDSKSFEDYIKKNGFNLKKILNIA
jgi:TP901 family phage tail tape measure protein